MDKKVIMYMHAGSGNHGCEALAHTVAKMLLNSRKKEDITLVTYRKYEDDRYTLKDMCNIMQERSFDSHKIAHIIYYVYRKITGIQDCMMQYRYKDALNIPAKMAISIGGDNYCYDSMQNDLFMANSVFNKKNIRTVLYGCSIEPDLINEDRIKRDLAKYHSIIARESITYNALLEAFDQNDSSSPRIYFLPDPAFMLPTGDVVLPEGFVPNNTVGINVSPIVQESESENGITMKTYRALIDYIVNNTDMQIALIPHVVWNGNDDRVPVEQLYNYALENGYHNRVVKFEDTDAVTLKGYISKLRFFIGARTHSTIAAYSNFVPTLVLGYSVKARGIAKDIFKGFEQDKLVIQVQNLETTNELKDSFCWLVENESRLREHLQGFMPEYIKRASEGIGILEGIEEE